MKSLPPLLLPTLEASNRKQRPKLPAQTESSEAGDQTPNPSAVLSPPVAVYWWVDSSGVRYVGQTSDPDGRRRGHLSPNAKFRKRFQRAKATMQVIRWTTEKHACRIEHQIIKAMKKRGQADLNSTRIPGRSGRGSGAPVFCLSNGILFASFIQCAQYFGVSKGTISNCIKLYGGHVANRDGEEHYLISYASDPKQKRRSFNCED